MNIRTNKIKYVSYHYRLTDRPAVTEFVDFNHGVLIAEIVEGKRQWPRLVEALEQCRRDGAVLVIAKLGRLGRNARFLSLLLESRVDFACLDNEQCNKFTVAILVATAEEESRRISERTKRTLAEAVKRKGIKLGSARPGHWEGREHLRGTKKAIAQSAKMRRQRTQETYRFIMPTLKEMREGGKTMDEIAEWLNNNGHTTTAGHPFNQVSVWRLLKRYLGDDFLGKVKDRGGKPQIIPCMEKTA
jgi:DNA invertase Pin-like site-specific DNA recombinase